MLLLPQHSSTEPPGIPTLQAALTYLLQAPHLSAVKGHSVDPPSGNNQLVLWISSSLPSACVTSSARQNHVLSVKAWISALRRIPPRGLVLHLAICPHHSNFFFSWPLVNFLESLLCFFYSWKAFLYFP